MRLTIGNGLDDEGRELQDGKTYAIYTEEDCDQNPDGAFGAIQCALLAEYDDAEGMFTDEFGNPVFDLFDFAHLQK